MFDRWAHFCEFVVNLVDLTPCPLGCLVWLGCMSCSAGSGSNRVIEGRRWSAFKWERRHILLLVIRLKCFKRRFDSSAGI